MKAYNSTLSAARKPLKRSPFKHKVGGGLKRSALKKLSKSPVAACKRQIQALLRQIVILRDKGCVVRHAASGKCSGPLQAEHLISRSNSATYGDPRNIVCLCQYHHIFWKPQYSRQYWQIIRDVIGEKRWKWVELAESDAGRHKGTKMDWVLVKLVLEKELAVLESAHSQW